MFIIIKIEITIEIMFGITDKTALALYLCSIMYFVREVSMIKVPNDCPIPNTKYNRGR
ncbi:hypothetical protein SDC9_162694 [bioreactor metagenome]|uniref:Uncharacterized protein n=1 Tax=bioreactor metagenome TaxID=1076179 RepID=A0A645FTE7_9ZZZZ